MLLTLTAAITPGPDFGYLLHKNAARVQEFDLAFGRAHCFYPHVGADSCTSALLLDVDPVGLVRTRQRPAGSMRALEQYVNDRPYVASSFLSVAIAQVFGSALAGKCKERPELAAKALQLEAHIPVLPCRGGEGVLRRLFEPLGYRLTVRQHSLDDDFPAWGASRYFAVTLESTRRLCELLAHLYVLVPVLDDEKHYWVAGDEVDKLLRHGGDWLGTHPERSLIAERYLKHQRSLTRQALEQLVREEVVEPVEAEEAQAKAEERLEERISLHELRLGSVLAVLKQSGARRVIDYGCGEGKLLALLMKERGFEEIVGIDVSHLALEIAAERLHLERLPPKQRERLKLFQSSVTYCDRRLAGYDAAAVVEVTEHVEPARLPSFERALFEFTRPNTIVVTTPNREYNVKFENLPAGRFRHGDHRFEWTRTEFEEWGTRVAARFGYTARFQPIGPEDGAVGAPTQQGVFAR